MKVIKYQYCNHVNRGTEEEPLWEEVLFSKEIVCESDKLAANEAIAKQEAYQGVYTVEEQEVPLWQ